MSLRCGRVLQIFRSACGGHYIDSESAAQRYSQSLASINFWAAVLPSGKKSEHSSWTPQFVEKRRYIHRHPVKRGLCEHPSD
jgi:hypothetical protein